MKTTPVRFCSIVLGWCIGRFGRTEEGQRAREQWEYQLELPLPGEDVLEVTESDEAEDAALFMAAFRG